MDISVKSFRKEVILANGSKTEIRFTGQQMLALIAHAEVMTPQLNRLYEGYKQLDSSRGGFDEELTGVAIAQATLSLSKQIDSEEDLFARGVSAFAAYTGSCERRQ